MTIALRQLEKNVSISFGYVKKDLLMLNDSVSGLHDQIQHLSLNQATLLEKFAQLEKLISGKKEVKTENKTLDFYDLKKKEKFTSSNYKMQNIKGRKFAVAVSPSGNKAYRIVSSKKTNNAKQKKVVKKTAQKPKRVIKETTVY